MTGAGFLVAVAGIFILGAAVMVWALCASAGLGDREAERAHDAEVLRTLASERVRLEVRDRLLHARQRQAAQEAGDE